MVNDKKDAFEILSLMPDDMPEYMAFMCAAISVMRAGE